MPEALARVNALPIWSGNIEVEPLSGGLSNESFKVIDGENAYVVRFGSLAMGVSLVAVRSVPDRLTDAAATLGAGRVRRFATVELPVMAPSLAAGAGLVLLSVMKELPISLLISPLGYSNLSTRIFLSFEDAFVAEAGIMAVVLIALSFALTWFLLLRRADHIAP